MSIILLLAWIAGITSFTLLGSWYARKYEKADLLIGFYVTFILVAQILAVKISAFDLGFKTFYGPSGVLVFAITFLLTDIVNEKFGLKTTQKMILIGFLSQIAMTFFFWVSILMNPAPFWNLQDAWKQIFGSVPRIVLASWIAFLISENLDAYIFSWFKRVTGGRHLWMRNAFSSLPSLALDSAIFITIAFAGSLPILPLILGQTLIKWLVGIIDVPFMYLNRWVLQRRS